MRDYLRERAARRFRLGAHDCGLFVADWVARVSGADPAAQFRGRYHDDASLAALAPDGLAGLFARAFAALVSTDAPQLGDVALILPGDGRPRGAICTGASYVTVAERGLWGIRLDVPRLAAWTV